MNEHASHLAEMVEEHERLGDTALFTGNLDEALDHYEAINNLIRPLADDAMDAETSARVVDALNRTRVKMLDARQKLLPPADKAAHLRAKAEEAVESGHIASASQVSIDLGDTLEELGDRDGAESAYRQAVALAREVDAAMPDLMLWAFRSLIDFLAPSEESIALAQEMAGNLVNRDEMYHPMRAAEAVEQWVLAELRFAAISPNRVDHVIGGIAQHAVTMLDDNCMHDKGQALQRQVAALLRTVGRDTEADHWQAEADQYEDWEYFMDQEIPGHVHLWDIRIDLSGHAGVDER